MFNLTTVEINIYVDFNYSITSRLCLAKLQQNLLFMFSLTLIETLVYVYLITVESIIYVDFNYSRTSYLCLANYSRNSYLCLV